MTATAEKLSYTVAEAAKSTGMSQRHLEREIAAGRLRTKRSGRNAKGDPSGSRLILADELRAWLNSLPDG